MALYVGTRRGQPQLLHADHMKVGSQSMGPALHLLQLSTPMPLRTHHLT
jgi:hypothetical protein